MNQFQTLFDLPTHLICVISDDGRFVETNNAQKAILGFEPSELIGRPVSEHVHPEDSERTFEAIAKLLETGGVLTDFRNRAKHKDGSYRWISWSGGAQNNQIVAIGTDVTAEVAAQEQAKLSAQQYEVMFESLPLIAVVTDSEGNPSYANSTCLNYFGTDDLKLVTRPYILSRVHPDDLTTVTEMGRRRLAAQAYEYKFRLKRFDNVYRWNYFRAVPIKGSLGETVSWLNTSADIHDQILAQSRLESLFQFAPACITINSGPDHRYLFSNEMNNIAVGRGDLVGKLPKDIFHGDERVILEIIDRVYKSGETLKFNEFPIKREWNSNSGETTRYLSSIIQPTRDDHGKVDGVMTFAIDVTDQVLARNELEMARAKAEAANQAKTRFLANISHEIRTPLTAILGFSEIALDNKKVEGTIQKYFERIKANGEQLLGIIGDVLDLSKVEAQAVVIRPTQVNLEKFLKDFIDTTSSLARKKDLQVKLEIKKIENEEVVIDQTLTRQILLNLISNAIKFSDKGLIKVEVEQQGNLLSADISDSGVGIPREQVAKLFEPFTQGDSSFTRKYAGSGLGLALSRSLARLLGGEVSLLSSEQGKGSVFRATIQTQSKSDAIQPPAPTSRKLHGFNGKVLLVEDSADNQYLVAKFLEKAGIAVDIANNGQEALELCKKAKYEVILMDIQMPVMDGYLATSELRKAGYNGRVIALTAHALSEEKEKALVSGFDAYLTKPIQSETLLRTITSN